MWIGVRERFGRFDHNLQVTPEQLDDGLKKQWNVCKVLQRAYYGTSTDDPPGLIVGSWGQGCQKRPTNDIDIFFVLPATVFDRFQLYSGKKQSALLQEVKKHLAGSYPSTSSIRGDGQVVQVNFNTIGIEVVPVFSYDGGRQFLMPDTNSGGSWKIVDPYAEQELIQHVDLATSGNARRMARMMKAWKRHCNVPLKSYQIVLLSMIFMNTYEHRRQDYFWFDWFMRDFFEFLCTQSFCNLTIPGTGEPINLGDQWLSRAISARDRARKSCDYEYANLVVSAGHEWQKIFGPQIPVHV